MTIIPKSLQKLSSAPLSSAEIILGSKYESEEWKLDGICRTVDPDMWFPEPPASGFQAKKLCARCPVIEECLEYAMANNEKFGVWGGLSAHERKKLKRKLRDAS